MGGLGIGSLRAKNLRLHSSSSLRKGTWVDIASIIKVIDKTSVEFSNSLIRKVSNGYNIIFWEDVWCDRVMRLKDKHPHLYALETNKDCLLTDRWKLTMTVGPGLGSGDQRLNVGN